jgi:hypothetical protein
VVYKPYRIAIPAKWEFSGLAQGLSKKQVQELKSMPMPDVEISIKQHFPLHVFFDQFRLKKYLKDDVPPLKAGKISMILLLMFFWLGFLIFLIATPLAYYLKQPTWVVDVFCLIGVMLLVVAIGVTFWDRGKKRGWSSEFLDTGPDYPHTHDPPGASSISFPDLSDGEGIVIILIILIAILLAMFFFVFIWLPILFVILNVITLGSIEDRYRTLEIHMKKPEKEVIDWLATRIIFSGGYLSGNWDPWITDKNILRTARMTRSEHRSFINLTIAFAIVSFVFAFFMVVHRIFINTYFFATAMIFGVIALGLFVYLFYLVIQGRKERKHLFSDLYDSS